MTHQPEPIPRADDCIVRPLRFTGDLPAMRSFLELLGMSPRVEAQRGGWLDMVAGAGMVALHDAAGSATGGRAGETRLSFEGTDLESLAARLTDAGLIDATIWDESYGRVLSVTDPDGVRIDVDGDNDDDYGYRVHRLERDPRWSVMPVCSTPLPEEYARFLRCFGLEWLTSEPTTVLGGHVGLVRIESDPSAIQLGFATTEPLEQVAERLRGAGGDDAAITDTVLTVTDPDGQPVVVHPFPRP